MRLRQIMPVAWALIIALAGSSPANIVIDTPAGLSAGDTFRIAFLTDNTTVATSSSIATYNAFVNADATAEAGGGLVTYNGIPLTFSAIASTPSVNVITNIGQTGAPVYLSTGTEVASSDTSASSGLWSFALFNPIALDLTGASPPINLDPTQEVWTGTQSNGQSVGGFPLSARTPYVGYYPTTGAFWVFSGAESATLPLPLYGISQLLTVISVVPEPASITMWGLLASCGAVGAYVRRRRAA